MATFGSQTGRLEYRPGQNQAISALFSDKGVSKGFIALAEQTKGLHNSRITVPTKKERPMKTQSAVEPKSSLPKS